MKKEETAKKIIINNNNGEIIGYVKDIRKYLHGEIEDQVKDWNNFENSICNMAHLLYMFECDYADDNLVKVSECPMDEFGIKIEKLEEN